MPRTTLILTICILATATLVNCTIGENIIIRDSVIYYKTNEISTVRAKWLATIVIDFDDFDKFMIVIADDIYRIKKFIERSIASHGNKSFTPFLTSFNGLMQEVVYLQSMRNDLITDVGHLRKIRNRDKRSLIPFIGEGLSWLFGLVTDGDIDRIRGQINNLANNQKTIVHVLNEGITMINESRLLIKENRQSINGIYTTLQQLNTKIDGLTKDVRHEIFKNRRFSVSFTRISLLMDEIKMLLQNARNYVDNLQAQIDFLALGKMSTRIIRPLSLQGLLLQIQKKLPKLMSLISSPRDNIWSFYRYLTTSAVFVQGKILIIISIPTLRLDQSFEVYRAFSVPVIAPLTVSNFGNRDLIANINLEAGGMIINKQRTKFQLLSETKLAACSHKDSKFCTIDSPVYYTSTSKTCLLKMFIEGNNAFSNYCTVNVRGDILPISMHLFDNFWAIISRKQLKMAKVCNGRHSEVISTPPIQIVKLDGDCIISTDYFSIASLFIVGQSSNRQEANTILKQTNFSSSVIWKNFTIQFPNKTMIEIPQALKEVKEVPLNRLLHEIAKISYDDSKTSSISIWFIVSTSITIIMIVVIVCICCKTKLKTVHRCLSNCMCVRCRGGQNAVQHDVELRQMEADGTKPSTDCVQPKLRKGSNAEAGATNQKLYPYVYIPATSSVSASKNKPSTSKIPTIKQTNLSYTYQVGDRAVLKCAIQNLGSKIVIWRKTSETHPLTVGAMTFDPEKRYEVENVSEKGEWNLFIKNVTHNDAGIYECQVSTKERYIRRLVQVIVKDREYKIPAITIAGTDNVVKGKTISLYCNVTGGKQAPDDLDWLKDNKKLTSSRSGRINLTKHISGITLSTASNLTINEVTQTDSGIYTCRSTGMAKNITVDVTNIGHEKRGATKDVPTISSAASAITVYYILIAICTQCSSSIRLFTVLITLFILSCTQSNHVLTIVLR